MHVAAEGSRFMTNVDLFPSIFQISITLLRADKLHTVACQKQVQRLKLAQGTVNCD